MSELWEQREREAKERKIRLDVGELENENEALKRRVTKLEMDAMNDDQSQEVYDRLDMLEQDMKKLAQEFSDLKKALESKK